MAKQFKNVADLITGLSEDESFKKDALKHISENGVGKFLAILRSQHKLTQQEMAEKISCSQGRISKIESSKNDSLSIKDLVDYGNALGLDLEIGFRPKKMTWVEMVKYHAYQMQKYLNQMVKVSKNDESIKAGVLDFHLETLKNVPRMILSSMAKLPNSPFNKAIQESKGKIHISETIQSQTDDVNTNNENLVS